VTEAVRRLVIAAALIASSIPAQAVERSMTLVNETGFDIVEFYGSTGTKDGGDENLLTNGALVAGSSMDVEFADHNGYCLFDFRAVFEDGAEIVTEDVNVCDWKEFYYRP
jgi:hypothetical protein